MELATSQMSLSLVLPTCNRPQFLRRVLRYYQACRFSHRILVADSSEASVAEANRDVIDSVRRTLSIEHRLYDPGLQVPMTTFLFPGR